jgi:hypothetical protein
MTAKQQAAWNAASGYFFGRNSGSRKRGQKERNMDLAEYGQMLDLHGSYSDARKTFQHGIDMELMDRAGGVLKDHEMLKHGNATEAAEQAHRHKTLQTTQFIDNVETLAKNRVRSISSDKMEFHPPGQAARKSTPKPPTGGGPAPTAPSGGTPPAPPSGGGSPKPAKPPKTSPGPSAPEPPSFKDRSFDDLNNMNRDSMKPSEKAAHTKALRAHPDHPDNYVPPSQKVKK